MNFSTWDSTSPPRRNPALSSGHIILEFDRTKVAKIFSHKLGQISFEPRDINTKRNEVIAQYINSTRYNSVTYTYIPSTLLSPGAEGFDILAHGHPITYGPNEGFESCVKNGMECAPGEGEDGRCNPGKCLIGKLSFVRNKKWKYESYNKYNNNVPFTYYLNGDKEMALKTVVRGKVTTFTDDGPVQLNIDKPASYYSRVLLPPKYYFSDDFLDSPVIVKDDRLRYVFRKPASEVIGIEDRKVRFILKILDLVRPQMRQEEVTSLLYGVGVTAEVSETLTSYFSELDVEWTERIASIVDEVSGSSSNNFELISYAYDSIKELFDRVVQVSMSSFRAGKMEYGKGEIARPIYSRLPGIAEGYRTDPLFSDQESPSQWLTSGADDFLSKKKDQLASFYQDYLDPQTCSPLVLDWLAQHVGLTGPLWDSRWERKIKVTLIENAFGWFDRSKTTFIPGAGDVKTPKGRALSKFPFTTSELWTDLPEEDNVLKICSSEINTISVDYDTQQISSGVVYKEKEVNSEEYSVSLVPTNSIKIYNEKWNGLMEAKGSLISFAFLSSIFELKAHTHEELEIQDVINGSAILRPRSGLRSSEVVAPPLWAYKSEVLQVGLETDLKINNYSNQLIAGVSRASSIEGSKNLFVRVPYYYNRNGKSWSRVEYITKNWLPDNLNKRIQYAYLSADLWAVGDAYFEPDIVSV